MEDLGGMDARVGDLLLEVDQDPELTVIPPDLRGVQPRFVMIPL